MIMGVKSLVVDSKDRETIYGKRRAIGHSWEDPKLLKMSFKATPFLDRTPLPSPTSLSAQLASPFLHHLPPAPITLFHDSVLLFTCVPWLEHRDLGPGPKALPPPGQAWHWVLGMQRWSTHSPVFCKWAVWSGATSVKNIPDFKHLVWKKGISKF